MTNVKLKKLEEQAVIVFGASSGIGRATALEFVKRGTKRVLVVGRKEEALQSLVHELHMKGCGEAAYILADTTNMDEVRHVAERAIELYGRIDTWAHIAGVGIFSKFTDITPHEFKRVVDVNLMGQVYAAMVAIPYMRQHGGALIHVSSVVSHLSFPLQSAYSAAKHGVRSFVDAMRLELQHDGIPISVTNIMPAAIDTPFFKHSRSKLGVEPAAPPPVYAPELVAEAIVDAAEKPTKERIVGTAGHFMVWGKRLFPGLMDMLMRRDKAFQTLYSKIPKAGDAPSELFGADTSDQAIHGGEKKKAA